MNRLHGLLFVVAYAAVVSAAARHPSVFWLAVLDTLTLTAICASVLFSRTRRELPEGPAWLGAAIFGGLAAVGSYRVAADLSLLQVVEVVGQAAYVRFSDPARDFGHLAGGELRAAISNAETYFLRSMRSVGVMSMLATGYALGSRERRGGLPSATATDGNVTGDNLTSIRVT